MPPSQPIPLGYIQLSDGAMAIYPMHDILINYTFENPKHWKALKLLVNLFICAYIHYAHTTHKHTTTLQPIQGDIIVKTQYSYFLSADKKTIRRQDIEITESTNNLKYLKLQNRANAYIPIDTRSTEYFGLGVGHSKGKPADQIWLLAEDVPTLLKGQPFARHILKNEATGHPHPNSSGILYVSLTSLSQTPTPVGELAQFLLGKLKTPQDETVKEIAATFNTSFGAFKKDKEVSQMLSLRERGWYDGLDEGHREGLQKGRKEGLLEGFEKLKALTDKGHSLEEAMQIIKEEELQTPPKQ